MFAEVVFDHAEDGSLKTESFVVIPVASDHSRIAAHNCIHTCKALTPLIFRCGMMDAVESSGHASYLE